MGMLLSEYAVGRDNNYNIIRFIAASLVLYSHSFPLSFGFGNAEPLKIAVGMTWGNLAVDVFFITSGFLITGSYFSRNNVIAFVWARVLRIYPALIINMIFCVYIVGLYFTEKIKIDYIIDSQTVSFFLRNSLLFWGISYKLPGVFHDIPLQDVVNGSLWTLPYEVKMYAILAFTLIFYSIFKKSLIKIKFNTISLCVVFSCLIVYFFNHFHPFLSDALLKFVRLFSVFFTGSLFYIYRDKIRLSSKWFFIALFILLASAKNDDLFFVFYYLFLPYIVFYLAYVPSGKIRKFNQFGDYSYGLYIYAFPVQQSVAAFRPGITVSEMILYSSITTFALSFLSWHLIEKRFLRMKDSFSIFENYLQYWGSNLRLKMKNK